MTRCTPWKRGLARRAEEAGVETTWSLVCFSEFLRVLSLPAWLAVDFELVQDCHARAVDTEVLERLQEDS